MDLWRKSPCDILSQWTALGEATKGRELPAHNQVILSELLELAKGNTRSPYYVGMNTRIDVMEAAWRDTGEVLPQPSPFTQFISTFALAWE
jgi:hypothetical protein